MIDVVQPVQLPLSNRSDPFGTALAAAMAKKDLRKIPSRDLLTSLADHMALLESAALDGISGADVALSAHRIISAITARIPSPAEGTDR